MAHDEESALQKFGNTLLDIFKSDTMDDLFNVLDHIHG